MPRAVKLLVTRRGRPLMVYKGATGKWALPGGKVEKGEGDIEALRRELNEELGGVWIVWLRLWKEFEFPAEKEKTFSMAIYTGFVLGAPYAKAELDAAAWVSTDRLARYDRLSSTSPRILKNAQKHGYL